LLITIGILAIFRWRRTFPCRGNRQAIAGILAGGGAGALWSAAGFTLWRYCVQFLCAGDGRLPLHHAQIILQCWCPSFSLQKRMEEDPREGRMDGEMDLSSSGPMAALNAIGKLTCLLLHGGVPSLKLCFTGANILPR